MPCHISVENQFPEDLHSAMGAFIDEHPQWDQYRLVQSGGLLDQRDTAVDLRQRLKRLLETS